MAKASYLGVNGVSRKVKSLSFGVNGVARKVKSGYIGINGVARQFLQGGVLASTLSVGQSVYLKESSTLIEYIIVNRGVPGAMYDTSCDGMWLMRKDLYVSRVWSSTTDGLYANSSIHTYLNGTFYNRFDSAAKSAIKEVKIPYCTDVSNHIAGTKSNGLTTKVFLPSYWEVGGYDTSDSLCSYGMVKEGVCFDYFPKDSKYTNNRTARIANLNGTATRWWTRTPGASSQHPLFTVAANGNFDAYGTGATGKCGARPTLIIQRTSLFNPDTMVLIGVA